jgi:predicted aspartyl protease
MKLELANYSDIVMVERGHATPNEVRRFEVEGYVDTGAAQLVIPASAMNALGLQESWHAKVKYADGHTASRPVVKNVWLRLCDRESVFSAIVEPGRDTALIGAIVMEALDLVVDCVTQTLHPRDPQQMLAEIE